MGRKKIERPSIDSLFLVISKMLVPENILDNFDIYGATQFKDYWEIEMREKEDLLPEELKEKADVVSDGYCNPVQAISHSFSAKPVYLKIFRRRWKESNSEKHYSNEYDFTLKGMKIVPELGIFLKEEDRRLSR